MGEHGDSWSEQSTPEVSQAQFVTRCISYYGEMKWAFAD